VTGYRHGVGPVQAELIRRGRESFLGYVMPKGYREIRAVRALVARGIVTPSLGWPNVYLVKESPQMLRGGRP
jgi:hypothetical protein